MPLDATNFHVLGPVKSADLLQFYNLNTGVMLDQPVTFRNALSIGGNQGLTTVPLKVYGATGQNTNLIDLYSDRTQAQPGFGLSAIGSLAWGPGGTAPQDTYLSRIALQNGHASDTPGLLVKPLLEVDGALTVNGLTTIKGGLSTGGATLTLGSVAITGTLSTTGLATLNSLDVTTTSRHRGAATFDSTVTAAGDVQGRYLRTTDGANGAVYAGNGNLYLRAGGAGSAVIVDVGTGLSVAAAISTPTLTVSGNINTAAISSADWVRVSTANSGIYNSPNAVGVSLLAGGAALYPSQDPIVGINTAQTMANKTLVDPRMVNQVALGGASYTFPAVGSSAGMWRYVKAWGQNLVIYLTNGTFILGTVQYASGQYTLLMGNSVSVYCDGSNWWVL